jgi:hypothetical protein
MVSRVRAVQERGPGGGHGGGVPGGHMPPARNAVSWNAMVSFRSRQLWTGDMAAAEEWFKSAINRSIYWYFLSRRNSAAPGVILLLILDSLF